MISFLFKNLISFLFLEKCSIDENEKSKKVKKEEIEEVYPNCNLSKLNGYKGWNIDLSVEDIIKKKYKQKKRKNKINS